MSAVETSGFLSPNSVSCEFHEVYHANVLPVLSVSSGRPTQAASRLRITVSPVLQLLPFVQVLTWGLLLLPLPKV